MCGVEFLLETTMSATLSGRREYQFVITNHVRERFVERFSRESRYFYHLHQCRGCEECRELTFWLTELVNEKKEIWDRIICAKLHDAEEVKVFNNDANFMDHMYKNYGYHRYHFLVEGEILFVVREADGQQIVLTCLNVNNPVNGSRVIANFINRPRYNRRAI
jgi:hypothetical protein